MMSVAQIKSKFRSPGHTVRADENAELILFSPQPEHSEVIDHVLNKINGGGS